jgi:S-methylmethionine-dependent homocysteine/selenocysteine methylase
MTRDESRQASSDARSEHVRLKNLARKERELVDRERKHIAALVGPGTDARYDDTGFSDGLL